MGTSNYLYHHSHCRMGSNTGSHNRLCIMGLTLYYFRLLERKVEWKEKPPKGTNWPRKGHWWVGTHMAPQTPDQKVIIRSYYKSNDMELESQCKLSVQEYENSWKGGIKEARNQSFNRLIPSKIAFLMLMLSVTWSIRDSNSSPLDCQSNALARWANAPWNY